MIPITLILSRHGEDMPTLILKNRSASVQMLTTAYGRQGDFEIELYAQVTKIRWPKTKEQLGYLHAEVFPKIAYLYRESGYQHFTNYEAQEEMIRMFAFREHINQNSGEVIRIPIRVSDMGKEELSDFIEKVVMWGRENGAEINDPIK